MPSDGGEPTTIDIPPSAAGPQQLRATSIDALTGSVTLEVSLLDADNVATERPYRVFLTAIEDQPPQVEVALKGIGSAVTPDVMIPIRGKISDDYAVAEDLVRRPSQRQRRRARRASSAWARAARSSTRSTSATSGPRRRAWKSSRATSCSWRSRPPTSSILAGEPHVATGDRYQLDVVTPEELLAQLEVREVGLRRRFELIIDEMTQLRDSLLRVKASLSPGAASGADPEDLRGDDDLDGQAAHARAKGRSGRPSCGCCACSGPCSRARNRWPKCWAWPPAFSTSARS